MKTLPLALQAHLDQALAEELPLLKRDGGFIRETYDGELDEMPLTWRAASLQMAWCLECHRAPERYVRPREEVFNPAWTPPRGDRTALGLDLVERYDIARVDDCSICHR